MNSFANTGSRAREIFLELVEHHPSAQWGGLLDSACVGDDSLRRQVERLLDAHGRLDGFMAQPAVGRPSAILDPASKDLGTKIGSYKLREVLGEGGMGIVYVAEQERPIRRKVALKVIKPGMDSKEVVARFDAERQALALMDHLNIAKVIDAGTTETGRPYFVMELVRGLPITDYCDRASVNLRERLTLFIQVCHAVQHAHQKGIIHRDLKPSNVMITLHDGIPIPKVIDFGVAKAVHQRLTEYTFYTRNAQLIGTPMYMSPEQAELSGLDVDTRSDVYSLGVLLYELLTGKTPFDKEAFSKVGLDEMRRIIRDEEPARPSQRVSTLGAELRSTVSGRRGLDDRQLFRALHGELDWIVMKALEKDRNRRYESASEMSQDLERHLDGEAVHACPPSASYRLRKLARRNRIAIITGGLVATALLLGTVVSTVQAFRATRAEEVSERHLEAEKIAHAAEQEAREAAEEAKSIAQNNASAAYRQQYKAEINAGLADSQSGNIARLFRTLTTHLPESGRPDVRGWEWYYLSSRTQLGRIVGEHHDRVSGVAWNPDGQSLATAGSDGTAIVWDSRTGTILRRFSQGLTVKVCIAWSPDGQKLAWGAAASDNSVRIWDRSTDEIQILSDHTDSVNACVWSPDGSRLATTAGDLTARIWDVGSGECLHVLHGKTSYHAPCCWTADGKHLIVVGPHIYIWDATTGMMVRELSSEAGALSVAATSKPPYRILVGDSRGNLRQINAESWEIGEAVRGHSGNIREIACSHDGATFATAGADGRINLWDGASGTRRESLDGHLGPVFALAWSPDDKQILSGGEDRTVRVWDIPPVRSPVILNGAGSVNKLQWSPEGRELSAIREDDRCAITWNVSKKAVTSQGRVGEHLWQSASPDGQRNAVADLKDGVVVIRVQDVTAQMDLGELVSDLTALSELIWSPNGQRLAAIEYGGKKRLHVWDIATMRPLFIRDLIAVYSVAWAPDSIRIAVAAGGDPVDNGYVAFIGNIHVFDVIQKARLVKLQMGTSRTPASAVAWHPHGTFVAGGNKDGLILTWAVETGAVLTREPMHRTYVRALDWSPDGRRVASISDDGTLKIWDPVSGDELLSLTTSGEAFRAVKWSSDGKSIAAADAGGHISVWDASAGYERPSATGRGSLYAQMRNENARRLIQSESYSEAVNQLSQAIDAAPAAVDYRLRRGMVHFRLQRYEEALVDMDTAIEFAPDDVTILRSRVGTCAALGRWKDVASGMKQILDYKQSSFDAYMLGIALLKLGQRSEFRQLCRAMSDKANSGEVGTRPTDVARLQTLMPDPSTDYSRQLPRLREYIAKVGEQNLPASLYSIGFVLYRVGQIQEAIEPLSQVSRTFEEYRRNTDFYDVVPGQVWYLLALAHHGLGHYTEAKKWFQKAEAYANRTLAEPDTISSRLFAQSESIHWHQRIALELLQLEARKVLNVTDVKPMPKQK